MRCSRMPSDIMGHFFCDGVGLGKTFIGLMLIERLVFHDRKKVVLFVPKAAWSRFGILRSNDTSGSVW